MQYEAIWFASLHSTKDTLTVFTFWSLNISLKLELSLKINEVLDYLQHYLLVERVAYLNEDLSLLVIVELPTPLVLDEVSG